jgi:hypothetical protein
MASVGRKDKPASYDSFVEPGAGCPILAPGAPPFALFERWDSTEASRMGFHLVGRKSVKCNRPKKAGAQGVPLAIARKPSYNSAAPNSASPPEVSYDSFLVRPYALPVGSRCASHPHRQ